MAGTTKKTLEKEVLKKTTIVEKTPDGTIELKISISWAVVEKQWNAVVSEMVKSANLPGFRKGKAPKSVVEKQLDSAKIKEETLRKILPQAYIDSLKEHDLKPIVNPRIHLEGELIDGKPWEFHAVTCELPEIELNDYKDNVKKVTAKSKIIVPGKEEAKPNFDEIVKAVLDSTKATIPQILIEGEADKLLSQTLDEIKKLGMTLDQYLSSTGKKPEDLRAEYAAKAQTDLKLEFVLQKIAETEKITVDNSEIEKTIENAKPEERAGLTANKYLLASIIRQQKTLDFLRSL